MTDHAQIEFSEGNHGQGRSPRWARGKSPKRFAPSPSMAAQANLKTETSSHHPCEGTIALLTTQQNTALP